MAEHVRHELARSGFPVRPARVGTLAHFLDGWGLPPTPPESLLHILIADALVRLRPARYAAVLDSRGLHAELVTLMQDVSGMRDRGEAEFGQDLASVFEDVEARLNAQGFALRNRRLHGAAEKLRSGQAEAPPLTIFDGFFTLSAVECELIEALAERGSVTVTLPEEGRSRDRLIGKGFQETRLTELWRGPERIVFSTATPEREAEEIARRILDLAALGRSFREMGVVLRSREPYGALIETALARFGIPARSYFLDPLASHPAVSFMAGVVRAMLGGWDYVALGELLRQPVSGVGATAEGDRFDFDLREKMPGRGLPDEVRPDLLGRFQKIAVWRRERLQPAQWAERLTALGELVVQPPVPKMAGRRPAPLAVDDLEPSGAGLRPASDSSDRDQVAAWRSTAAAGARFDEVVAAAAEFAGSDAVLLEDFWRRVETALAVETLQVDDRRRDVVHIMDVYEARQWELPVVFVCGLLERVFPKYHGENPVLGDAARRRLGLPTSEDAQAEEKFLFDLAATRATEQVVLSYPRFDEKGEETLPSFFLKGEKGGAVATRVRPKPKREVQSPPPGPIEDAVLLRDIAKQRRTLSATGIESFLQCPFQFFARHTLRLRERPKAPRDRLDVLLQGSIIHRALAELIQTPLLGAALLDQVFEEECARKRVPRTYRTEAVRLELLRHFEMFLEDHQVELGWKVQTEQEFKLPLTPELTIRGRIDRLETGPGGEALVIDYKYSGQVADKVEQNEAGELVQGGLYLLAAERVFRLEPTGMLYCGVKKKVAWEGWHAIPALREVGEFSKPTRMRELAENAARSARETHAAILGGDVAVHPANRKKCDWCDYRDICRVESMAAEVSTGAGS